MVVTDIHGRVAFTSTTDHFYDVSLHHDHGVIAGAVNGDWQDCCEEVVVPDMIKNGLSIGDRA